MSGTSADAIDAALVDFSSNRSKIVSTYSQSIPENIKTAVHALAISGHNEIKLMRELDRDIARYSCNAIEQICQHANIRPQDIEGIGSHGQTIRHYPPQTGEVGYSLQVGDPNIIAHTTGITTVADFRRRDIAAGGHGAPLAPAFHNYVFRSQNTDRIIVNLGGIANITVLNQHPVIGYDTGPANGLMDSWCQKHLEQPYDAQGQWAASGQVQQALLAQLLQHPFFGQAPPKSTGREDFNLPWLEEQLRQYGRAISTEDVQATLLQLTVESLSQAIEHQDAHSCAEIYVCGGGAYNTALLNQLAERLSPRLVNTTAMLSVDPDWVEAVAFAWLAKQTLAYAAGNLPSVTGATCEVILGGIYPGS